ncbi:glycoside hydrolase domain-containing protein [Streptomyces xiamenensis]
MADAKVLEGQRWVNQTYKNVPGYRPCPETGTTGWATMYSLTMGLQHELGISPVVANFGPGTLSRLQSRGSIGAGEKNGNLVNIIQYALFAKGYWGGNGDGVYSFMTADAVNLLAFNAGLGNNVTEVSPKIFRALLTMDAYLLTSGGSADIRSIQQWLNSRYINRSTFFIIPCDGHYTRDVQTALMKAIQYELGIPDDQATGNFGPATKDGLRARHLREGNSGIFVRLFSAAGVFNGAAYDQNENPYHTTFKETFDSNLTSYIRAFQYFSQIPVTGEGDFATWAQLLVSTGDPDRAVTACDTSKTITASRAVALRNAGYRVVGRYLDERATNPIGKEIQPGELDSIFDNGLRVFPISQYDGRFIENFTYGSGYQHALWAHDRAQSYGFNRGTVIYFSVDYDATQDEVMSNIIPYFNGVSAGLAHKGKRYVHGVYGSRNVCAQVTKYTYARWSFVSGMSWGFSGNLGFPLPANWSFNQIKEFTFQGGSESFALDNVAHRPGTDPGTNRVNQQTSPSEDFMAYISQLFQLAQEYGKGNPNELVMQFFRHQQYNDFRWRQLIGGIDDEFVSFALRNGVSLMKDFIDPFYGIELGTEHLMATCHGHYLEDQPSGNQANRGDVAGWGGDLMTFYGEWRRDAEEYASGYLYCKDRLAKLDVPSTFPLSDLIEDADGYNIARRVKAGERIDGVIRNYYTTGGANLSRFKRYYTDRFKGSNADVISIARHMLTYMDDIVVVAGRDALIIQFGGFPTIMPNALPGDKFDPFLSGFADTLQDIVGRENALRVNFLEQHERQ